MPSNTLYDKIWSDHIVVPAGFAPAMLYIDLHLIHEVTSAPAFDTLRRKGISVRRPDRTPGEQLVEIGELGFLWLREAGMRPGGEEEGCRE